MYILETELSKQIRLAGVPDSSGSKRMPNTCIPHMVLVCSSHSHPLLNDLLFLKGTVLDKYQVKIGA